MKNKKNKSRKYKSIKNKKERKTRKTRKQKGGVTADYVKWVGEGEFGKKGYPFNFHEFELLKMQRLIDKYGETDQENLRELQDKINQNIVNYITKSSAEKKALMDKIDSIHEKIFVKREN